MRQQSLRRTTKLGARPIRALSRARNSKSWSIAAARNGGTARSERAAASACCRSVTRSPAMPITAATGPAACILKAKSTSFTCVRNFRASASAAACSRPPSATWSRAGWRAWWSGRCRTTNRRSSSTAPSADAWSHAPRSDSAPSRSTRSRLPGRRDLRLDSLRPNLILLAHFFGLPAPLPIR